MENYEEMQMIFLITYFCGRQRGICLLLHENPFSIKKIMTDLLSRSVRILVQSNPGKVT